MEKKCNYKNKYLSILSCTKAFKKSTFLKKFLPLHRRSCFPPRNIKNSFQLKLLVANTKKIRLLKFAPFFQFFAAFFVHTTQTDMSAVRFFESFELFLNCRLFSFLGIFNLQGTLFSTLTKKNFRGILPKLVL